MMVDPAEYVDQEDLDEKDEVAIINPDQLDEEVSEKPRADNCMFSRPYLLCSPRFVALTSTVVAAMKEIIFQPTIENPPILAEAEHTWHIQNWRDLGRREHGPVFEAGGQPW
jgi:ubiquitin carboxyl-terminal hydrolase 7